MPEEGAQVAAGTDLAQAATTGKSSLEDLLAGLDDDTRKVVLGEVTKARTEAKSLRERVKAAEPSLKELADLKAKSQTDTERWEHFANEQKSRADKAERDAMVSRVALRKGLTASLAGRLQGDDEASLEADADELLALIPTSTNPRAPRVDQSQGSSGRGGAALSPRDEFAAILKNNV